MQKYNEELDALGKRIDAVSTQFGVVRTTLPTCSSAAGQDRGTPPVPTRLRRPEAIPDGTATTQ